MCIRCPTVVEGCINVTKRSDSPTAFGEGADPVPTLTSPALAGRRRRASATTVETGGEGVAPRSMPSSSSAQHRPPIKFTPTSGVPGEGSGSARCTRVLPGGYVGPWVYLVALIHPHGLCLFVAAPCCNSSVATERLYELCQVVIV